MGKNLNLRHIYLIRFLIFGSIFCAFGFQVWKSTNMTKNIMWTNKKRYQKAQNFMLISNPLKKFFKNAFKKIISINNLRNMSKSGKSAYFVTFLLITFFGTCFKNFINWFETFSKLWMQMRKRRLKKRKTFL
jgi:hypothetical protein